MTTPLRPALTLADALGPGRAYAPRAHPRSSRWLPGGDPSLFDALTGNQLAVVGDMPVVCSVGAATDEAMDLYALAGLAPATDLRVYRGEADAARVVRELAASGRKLVIQHVYPAGELPDEVFWVRPQLLSRLNNKANLGAFVPAAHVPPRAVRAPAEVFGGAAALELPIVLKAATDGSSTGGAAVAVCRTRGDLTAAAERLAGCDAVIVEPFLRIAQNVCLHFAVMPDGAARYFGHAEQDVTPGGQYRGNWIDAGTPLDPRVVDACRACVERAAAEGYRGIAGIDAAVLDDGRVVVLDLNFRVNGSTAAVLLAPAVRRARGPCVMHLRGFVSRHDFRTTVAAAAAAVRRGTLIPLGAFDPAAAGHAGHASRVSGLVIGPTRADVARAEADLATAGLA